MSSVLVTKEMVSQSRDSFFFQFSTNICPNGNEKKYVFLGVIPDLRFRVPNSLISSPPFPNCLLSSPTHRVCRIIFFILPILVEN